VHRVVDAFEDGPPLQRAVERHPEVAAHHGRKKDRARRLGVLGDVARHRGGDGRDPSLR
jgi:hypothetical protein